MAINSAYMATTINDGGGRSTSASLVYDPVTGTWVPASAGSGEQPPNTPKTDSGTPTDPNSGTQVDSTTEAEKEYIEIEFNTLTGDLSLTSTEKSIRIKVNDTIKLEGLGKYLSGLYFVSAVKRTLNKDSGYTHSLTLMKNGFGDSLKSEQPPADPPRGEEVPKTSPEVSKGESVKIVGDSAVYSNAHDGVKVPAWVKQKTLTVAQVSADGSRVLVQPINSWVYAKYVQKF